MGIIYKYFIILFLFILPSACATYNTQIKNNNFSTQFPDKEIDHTFYLIGDAGNSAIGTSTIALQSFKQNLSKASKNSTAIFLGDNIYPKGLPKKGHKNRTFAEHQLDIQTEAVQNFKGETIFIPGNHDWYSGLSGLKRQEKYIEEILGKNTFLPVNGCPIENRHISEDIELIIIDSEWYLTNWDSHPTINDDCEIKTRSKFFDELEGLIKKARGKTTLIALHHPMFTNGSHGGQYSFKSHLTPLPVLGSLKNLIRKTSGISPADIQNSRYNEFRKRIITLSQENDKTIFISGHDHNLQYLVKDNIPQIVSGSGSKKTATRNVDGEFSSSDPGFAILDVFKDGSSVVRFYSAKGDNLLFQKEIFKANEKIDLGNYDSHFSSKVKSSVYSKDEITKSKSFTWLWGERYRKYFGTEILAPTVNLDTLYGGLKPVRKGGGHQSKSLRLVDNDGKEYVMRALRKNAVQYLQAVAFKDKYIEGQFNDTYTEKLLMDVFTGSHPYAPFTIATLSDALGIYHTNPILYYVPKQLALGDYNSEYGNELYMIEERASDGHGNLESFGYSNTLISTDDLLKNLRKNDTHYVDERAYVRARLFDMLIGDWDRHEDQWRWAVFKDKNGNDMYRPVPRDRDQAFSIMADGFLLNIATTLVPALRLMQSYDEELRSPKWFNLEPYPLDMALINNADRALWEAQAKHIQQNLTDSIIDKAFTYFPEEVNDETVDIIKRKLKGRRSNLNLISDNYYRHINKYAVITGTDKDDWFELERMPNGKTKVTAYRIINGVKGRIIHDRIYNKTETKEIWIYGLDDEDNFEVKGNGDNYIKIRLVGGQNNDRYHISNGSKTFVYDFKSKKNTLINKKGRIRFKDDYETNIYNYKKLKNSSNQFIPTIGSNPDDGFKFGLSNTFTLYGFERNPFTQQHTLAASYYFATRGYDISYNAEFANIIGNMNLGIEGKFTSPNFSSNFFGFGNSTPNFDDDLGLDYNRVKLRTIKISPTLIWRGISGASFKTAISYESVEVEETEGRFINDYLNTNDGISQAFFGGEVTYQYENYDNKAFPTLGMMTSLKAGFKINEKDLDRGFAYLIPEIGFDNKLVSNGRLVLATKLKAHLNFGDDFEFYQAANIGANNGLRGYRNERFTGKNAFFQNTDLRFNFRKLKTGLIPLQIGLYGGFDYGRVWVANDLVSDPDYNSETWNTSIGGGIFVNAADMITGNLSFFNSSDGLLVAFTFGFGF